MSGGVASVTAAMHGSNSTSSLESLEQLTASPFSDEDDGGVYVSIDMPPQQQTAPSAASSSHPTVVVSHGDSDDSDDDSDDGDRKSAAAVIQMTQLTGAAERSRRRASASASSRSSACFSIALLDSDDRALCLLPPEQEDIFSLESFCSLHQQRRALGKQLIIAQVSTRDKNCTRLNSTVFSYYDALPLLRVLFRVQTSEQRGGAAGVSSVRHRYHQYQTVTPVNPLTATCIIGDVRFFMADAVDGPTAAAVSPFPPSPSSSSPSAACSSDTVNARYLGSDYNFAFSPAFRALFFPHSLSSAPAAAPVSPSIAQTPSDSSPLSSSASPTSDASDSPSSSPSAKQADFLLQLDELLRQPQKPRARTLGWVGQQAEQLHALVSGSGSGGSVDWPEYLQVPFPRAMAYGTVVALYGLLCFLIFEQSMMEAINGDVSDALQLSGMWWYIALPPLMLIVDCMTGMLFRTREPLLLWLLKAALFAVYYTGPLVFLTGEDAGINLGRRLLQMLMPVLFLIYSILFFFWHWRTTRLD